MSPRELTMMNSSRDLRRVDSGTLRFTKLFLFFVFLERRKTLVFSLPAYCNRARLPYLCYVVACDSFHLITA